MVYDKDLRWEKISEKHIVKNRWIDMRELTYKMPNGDVMGPFYNYSRKNYSVIVARDEDGNFVCVRQFRQGIGCVTTEFPAGGIERADGREYGGDAPGTEDTLSAAQRELLEESGYVSDKWTFLMMIPSDATVADNYAYLYFADECRRVAGQDLDSTEFLDVTPLTGSDLDVLIAEGHFEQAMHVLAYQLVKHRGLICVTPLAD